MDWTPLSAIRWLFSSQHGASDRLIPRWLFLRAFGLIYFSAFFSLVFQIRGLIGPDGILPAGQYLQAVAQAFGHASRLWYAPTLLWFSSSSTMLVTLCWVGMAVVAAARAESLAARHARNLLRLLSFLRQRRAGFLRVPVRRNAARSRFHRALLCSARISPRPWPLPSTFARQPVPAAVGVVPHLLRVRRRKNCQRRPAVAAFHRHGRVLPERPPAHLDRLVHSAPPARVSCLHGLCHPRAWSWVWCG